MTSVLVALVAALVAAALGSLAPWVVARLPQPQEPEPETEPDVTPPGPLADLSTGDPRSDGGGDALAAADPFAAPEPLAPAAADRESAPVPPGSAPVDWPALARTPGLAGWSAAVAGTAAGTVALVLGPDPAVPAWTALAVVGTWLGWIDWRTRLLPKRLVIPAYLVIGPALLVAGLVSHDRDALVRSAYGWVGTFGVYALLWLVHPRGLGYGDVRLSGVLGMALGWIGWSALVVRAYAGFLLGAVIGGLLALARVVDRRGYPFGPFMLIGAWLGAVTSPATVGWF